LARGPVRKNLIAPRRFGDLARLEKIVLPGERISPVDFEARGVCRTSTNFAARERCRARASRRWRLGRVLRDVAMA
jgi:hypothetical protein